MPRPKRTCSVEGCSNVHYGRGWCRKHHRIHTDYQPPPEARRCGVPDCENLHYGIGLCSMHYQRLRRTGSLEPRPKASDTPCSKPGCELLMLSRGLCRPHYLKWWRQDKSKGAHREARTYKSKSTSEKGSKP